MAIEIDIDAVLKPIAGENPAGADLRYTLHDEIKEARRADDPLERGDWQREIKKADWETVLALCRDALTNQTKDLQIAVWLTEALTVTGGFKGFLTGLKVINGFLQDFWDNLYPQIEDDDLEFRVGRLELLNNSLWSRLKQIPLTDRRGKAAYSWLQWEQSRQVGYEGDAAKAELREEHLAEGKPAAEDFDSAVVVSSRAFYEALAADIEDCIAAFQAFEQLVDEKFGKEAPRLSELRDSLEDCRQLVMRILKEKRVLEPDEEDPAPEENPVADENMAPEKVESGPTAVEPFQSAKKPVAPQGMVSDPASREDALWQKACELLKTAGIRAGLQQLQMASTTAPSVRERTRHRLLMAKLCLEAERPDLARPILEELHALIEELNLERWEASSWIADVLEGLYKCLTAGDGHDDPDRAEALFRKMCTLDVTKAMIYKH
jgi:type VI secretion system protein ImpA